MSIFPDPLYYQEGQLRGVEQRSGKVNFIFYKLNLFPIFLVDKVKKKKTEKLSFVGPSRFFLLSKDARRVREP